MASADIGNLMRAYRTTDAVEAQSLAAELNDAGVETYVLGDYRNGAYAGGAFGSASDNEIWIKDADREAAEPIVTDWQRKYHPKDLEPVEPTRYSLKTLLIAMTIAAVGFGMMAGPHPEAFGLVMLLYAVCVIYVWKKLRRRRDAKLERSQATDSN